MVSDLGSAKQWHSVSRPRDPPARGLRIVHKSALLRIPKSLRLGKSAYGNQSNSALA